MTAARSGQPCKFGFVAQLCRPIVINHAESVHALGDARNDSEARTTCSYTAQYIRSQDFEADPRCAQRFDALRPNIHATYTNTQAPLSREMTGTYSAMVCPLSVDLYNDDIGSAVGR